MTQPPYTCTLPRKPLGSKEERTFFWGKKKMAHPRHFCWADLKQKSQSHDCDLDQCLEDNGGKEEKKKRYFSFSHNIRFPHSALSQNYLFESGVLSYTHGAKSLLIPSRKSASSVCLSTFLCEAHYHLSGISCDLSVLVLHHWCSQGYFGGEKWGMCPDSCSYLHIL